MLTKLDIWQRLSEVESLKFVAKSDNATGWNGNGSGNVIVDRLGDNVITFTESGSWQSDAGLTFGFNNVFRWTLADGKRIRLEHLRFGVNRPVYLFDLTSADESQTDTRERTKWSSSQPHICREDQYVAHLSISTIDIHLQWTVTGPEKNEHIDYWYSSRS